MKELAVQMGKRLRKARKDAGLSRKKLADALGTTHASIARWEGGVPIPSTALATISKMTKAPIEYFLFSEEDLSESKHQTTLALAHIIDAKDTEIDKLTHQVSRLQDQIKNYSASSSELYPFNEQKENS